MSDEEKKNGEYEKPESHDVGGEELDDVSGGSGDRPGRCDYGQQASAFCETGGGAMRCLYGNVANPACRNGGLGPRSD